MSIYDLTAYEVIRDKELSDLKSRGVLLKHQKSGARVLLMENDDENKKQIGPGPHAGQGNRNQKVEQVKQGADIVF